MRHLFTFLILLISSQVVLSQSVNISGSIKDSQGEALIGVNVYLEDTYDGATSDVEGNYSFSTNEKGTFFLVSSIVGYETQKIEIVLDGNPIINYFILKEKFNELKAVTITAGAFSAGDTKKATVLSSLEVVTTAGASGDITGAMQTLPGTSTNGEDGRLFVRGGSGEETQTFINGTMVQAPYTPAPPNTASRGKFNPFMFQGILFSTGGYSAEYGQALSAALILDTKDKAGEDLLNISIATIFGGVGGTKVFEKGAVSADLSYTNLAPYMAVSKQNLDWIKPYESLNGSLSVSRDTKKDGLLKVYSSFSTGDFALNSENINNPTGKVKYDLNNQSFFTNMSWKGILSDSWSMHAGGAYTLDKQQIFIDDDNLDKELEGTHTKMVLTHHFTEKANLKMGVELMTKNIVENYSDQSENTEFSQGFSETKPASFVESQLHLSNRLAFSIGMRAEHSDLLKQNTLAPRVSMAYKLNENNQVSFAFGHFYQDPLDDYLKFSTSVHQEKAEHYIVNFQHKTKGRLLRAETYFKKYDELVKIINPSEFYLPSAYDNSGDGYAYGLDLFYKDSKSIKNGTYWVSYSYLDSKRNFRDYPEEAIPSFVSQHNVSFVYKHWIPKIKTMFSGTYNFNSPRRFNNPNTPEFNNELGKAYQSLNLSVSYLHRQNIIFYTALSNAFGYKNVYGQQYSNTPNEFGEFNSREIRPASDRFFFLGCFITLTKKGDANQLNTLD